MKIWVQRVHGPVSGADSNRTELEVDEHVTVARLKVKYIESGSAGTHDYVSLYYDGAELDDRRPISDYGISEGDAVVHQSAVLHPYAPIDYTKLADAVDAEVGDRSWGRGEEWQHFPPILVGRTWASVLPGEAAASQDLIAPSRQRFAPRVEVRDSRTFVQQYMCVVKNCKFSVLHRMEGRWNGEATTLRFGAPQDITVSSSSLTFDTEGFWRLRQALTNRRGHSSVQWSTLEPIADGLVRVSIDSWAGAPCEVRMEERGHNVLLLTAIATTSGKPLMVETITLIDDMRRTRTAQHFDLHGDFQGMYVIREQRVIDAQTGAVEAVGPSPTA